MCHIPSRCPTHWMQCIFGAKFGSKVKFGFLGGFLVPPTLKSQWVGETEIATEWILQMTWRAEWEFPSFLLLNYFLDHYCHHSSQVSYLFLSDFFDFLDYKGGKYAIARYTSITVWFMPIRNTVGHKWEILFVLIFWIWSWETETTQCLELKQQF